MSDDKQVKWITDRTGLTPASIVKWDLRALRDDDNMSRLTFKVEVFLKPDQVDEFLDRKQRN